MPISRERPIFEAALEITEPAERQRYLEAACAGDAALRAAVEELLQTQGQAERFFAQNTPGLGVEGWLGTGSPEGEVLGERIGPYRLVEKLGEGGCGVVYRAEQEAPVRRPVALKVIKLGMDTRSVIARFRAEQQALGLMEHPNIARVYEAGATERGRPYFVMELVQGSRITEFCDTERLALPARLELFIEVCQAIQHAHQKGIIHRDIKPSNVLVAQVDGRALVKVIDFGVAKSMEGRLTEETIQTRHTQLLGTPAYMSPEQVAGGSTDLDTRSDIYALGVLLYELLVGRLPFGAKELTRLGEEEMRRMVREEVPRPPSLRLRTLPEDEQALIAQRRGTTPAALRTEVRGDLDCIVAKTLEKERTQRYATARELALDLSRYLESHPVQARPPSRRYRLGKLVRRHRVAMFAGGLVAVVLLLAATVSTWMLLRERAAYRAAAAAREEAQNLRTAEQQVRLAQATTLLGKGNLAGADALLEGVAWERPSPALAKALRAVGRWHAEGQRWKPAVERLAALVRVNSAEAPGTVAADYLQLGLALVQAGELNEYERVRQEAVRRLAAASAGQEVLLKACLLLPANKEFLHTLAPLAEAVRPAGVRGALERALYAYRCGEFAPAAEGIQQVLAEAPEGTPREAAARALRALVSWQMNLRHEVVYPWFEAVKRLRQATPSAEGAWSEWELARLLVKEGATQLTDADHAVAQTPVLDGGSDQARLLRLLGEWHAVEKRWGAASERFTVLRKVNAQDDWEPATQDYLAAGGLLAKLGQRPAYTLLQEEAAARFHAATHKVVAERIVRIVLLRPVEPRGLQALEPLVAVLERPLTAQEADLQQNAGFQLWETAARALLEYRRGRYAEAAEWARRTLPGTGGIPLPTQVGRLVLALALSHLGQGEAARAESAQVRRFLEEMAPYVDCSNWRDWLYVESLMAEVAESERGAGASVAAGR